MVLGRVGSVGLARPRCRGHAAEHGHAPIPGRVTVDWTAQVMRMRRKVGKLIFFHRCSQKYGDLEKRVFEMETK